MTSYDDAVDAVDRMLTALRGRFPEATLTDAVHLLTAVVLTNH
ncbi:hypothetical protein [Mycolicibacterium obuense]|nr:hypothetical protein [Mycolicibacterium obuense]